METQSCAEQEFAYADLGDQRRKKRLIQLANSNQCFHIQSCEDSASTKAAYRFHESLQAILPSHIKVTPALMN